MKTIKPVLWSRPTVDGEHQIKIRITNERKSVYVDTGIKISKSHWNNKTCRVRTTHSDATNINSLIDDYLFRYYGQKKLQSDESNPNDIQSYQTGTLGKLLELRIADFRSQGRIASVRRHHTLYEHFKAINLDLVKVGELTFLHRQQIDSYFINVLQIESSTRNAYHKAIKSILTYAQGLPQYFKNPEADIYYNHKVSFKPKTKVSLKGTEMHKMFDAINWGTLNKNERHATQLFLFSFSTMGMRFKDVLSLKWENIKDGFIDYEMSKNKRNIRVKLNEIIVNILKFYLPNDMYKNPYIDYKSMGLITEHPLNNTISKQIYRLEEKYYNEKMREMQLLMLSQMSNFTPEIKESPKVVEILKNRDDLLFDLIKNHVKNAKGYIFFEEFNKKSTIQQIYDRIASKNALINRYLKDVSKSLVLRVFSFHSARHTFAYLSRKNKIDIFLISKCLGHSSLAITEQYLREFEDTEVYKANDQMVDVFAQFYK
jgi:integrase